MANENGAPTGPNGSPPRSSKQGRLPKLASTNLGSISERLQTPPAPPIPRRSSRRRSGTGSPAQRQPGLTRPWLETRASHDTGKSAPPAYDWVPEPMIGEEKGNPPVEGEELAKLRRSGGWRKPSRGGWGRLWIIVGVAAVVLVALAIGLGVGLSKKGGGSSGDDSSDSGSSSVDTPPQQFPLGQYSFVTALVTVQTTCTSNPATWLCYPFTVFDEASGSGDTSSLAYFNWMISSTDDTYATVDGTPSTPDSGVPANLTVTATNDPFGITFNAKPLTYIASSSNSSSPRYTFSFTMPKTVVPSPTIATDGSTSECYFNETIFTGNIYLRASREYPADKESTSIGGYEQWPYAVEVKQTAFGGSNVPDCYETSNGDVGAPITDLVPQSDSYECLCDYRNYY